MLLDVSKNPVMPRHLPMPSLLHRCSALTMAGPLEALDFPAKNHPFLQHVDPAWPAMSTPFLIRLIPLNDPTKISKKIESASDWNKSRYDKWFYPSSKKKIIHMSSNSIRSPSTHNWTRIGPIDATPKLSKAKPKLKAPEKSTDTRQK